MVFWFEGKVWLRANFLDDNKIVFSAFRNTIENDVFDLPDNLVQFFSCNVGCNVGSFDPAG